MLHKQTEVEVNAWGLTQIEMDAVLSLQSTLGGSELAFDYAYEVITSVIPLGTYAEKTEYRLKMPGANRATTVNERDLSVHYRIPNNVMQPDYLQQRWNV